EPTIGDPGQLDRTGAVGAYRGGAAQGTQQRFPNRVVRHRCGVQVTRHRRLDERPVGDRWHRFSVASGWPSWTTRPQVVRGRMVDGTEQGLTGVGETHSATPQRDAGRVVVGAVDGVDEPGPAAWL